MQGWGIAILRIVMGIIFLMGGIEKLFIEGPDNTMGLLIGLEIPLPLASAIGIALLELLCGLALLLGIFTRCSAVLLALAMLVDTVLVHGSNGFFVYNGGYEYALLRLADSVALILVGSGRLALDNVIAHRKRTKFPCLPN